MATLLTLTNRGRLFKLDPILGPGELECRHIYMFPRVKDWFLNILPNLESTWNIEMSPAEQVDALVQIFCSGRTLTFGWHFSPLRHIESGIWELKTADTRIFGWFHIKDCFIGTDADATFRVKQHGLYQGYRKQAARYRDSLELDEPKFIPGDDPNEVVSDFDYP